MIFPCDSLVISFSVINYVVSLASRVNVASRRKMKKDTLPGVLFYINATNYIPLLDGFFILCKKGRSIRTSQ